MVYFRRSLWCGDGFGIELWWYWSGVMVVLRLCCGCITMVLGDIEVVLRWCYGGVAMLRLLWWY